MALDTRDQIGTFDNKSAIVAEQKILDRDDKYELICDMGREAADSLDEGRYTLGTLAAQIETRYNEHTIADFAIAVGVEKKRVYEYRQVIGFMEQISVDADYRAANPQLRYSHYRCAMRFPSWNVARKFLDECSTEGWTVEQARLKVLDALGKPEPPKKLLDATMLFAHLPYELRLKIADSGTTNGKLLVRLVISEVAV